MGFTSSDYRDRNFEVSIGNQFYQHDLRDSAFRLTEVRCPATIRAVNAYNVSVWITSETGDSVLTIDLTEVDKGMLSVVIILAECIITLALVFLSIAVAADKLKLD